MQEKTSHNAIFFIIERLKAYFQIVTDIELSKILEVKPNTISTWRNRNTIDWELIFAKCDNINLNWLLTGEGPMLRGIKPDEINRFSSKADTYLHTVRIPLYNVEAIGGVVEVYDSIADTEPIAWLEIPNLPKCDGAIYMVGDSMYPLLKSGDIIIYKVLNDLQNILWGEMYLLSIAHNGDAFLTVKYVKQSDTPGYVTLICYNEHHQPKDFPFDSIRFAAHIKASVRINSMG